MSVLTELSRSPDGDRLIVGDPYDHEYRESDDAVATEANVDSIANLLGASGAVSSRTVSPSATGQAVLPSHRKEGGNGGRVGAEESNYSGVPRVPRQHMTLLRGRGGAQIGNPEKAFVDDGDEDEQEVTTVAAIAAAAFAGGWFSALLAVTTMACWSELSGSGGEGQGGWWRVGGGWLVRMLTYGR